jgi:O-antigen biosynthesis protein
MSRPENKAKRKAVPIEFISNETLAAGPRVSPEIPKVLSVEKYDFEALYSKKFEKFREMKSPEFGSSPEFSVVVPVFNPAAQFLEACIRSVRAQTYGNWELILVNTSTSPLPGTVINRFASIDSRIKVFEHENQGIALNTDFGIQQARAPWILFLDHDDEISPIALDVMRQYIEQFPRADFVYSDEDKISEDGTCSAPFAKPDWSPDLLLTNNYICHLTCMRKELYESCGGLRPGFDGAQDYDLFLRATSMSSQIVHIPEILYHWRVHPNSTASSLDSKPDAAFASQRALGDFLSTKNPGAWREPGPAPTTHRVRYPYDADRNLVSVIVPFKDQPDITQALLESISEYHPDIPFELLLVSNNSSNPTTFQKIEQWKSKYEWLRVVEHNVQFNYQEINNWAVLQTKGNILLFLNNDVEVMHPNWLRVLAENAVRPEIGAVGAQLFYPNGTIQHAGVTVGIRGFADHVMVGNHPHTVTAFVSPAWTRNVLAVTGAALAVERSKFEKVGGFDERFQICGGDVDLCIRLYDAGFLNLYVPSVRMLHHESLTRDPTPPANDFQESRRSYKKYLEEGDPFYNRLLTLNDTSCLIDIEND